MVKLSAHKQAVNKKKQTKENERGRGSDVREDNRQRQQMLETEARSVKKIRTAYHRQHQAAGKQMVRIQMDGIQLAALEPHTIIPCLTQSDVCWNK